MHIILGGQPEGVPFVTFSKCIFDKESNKENAFSNLQQKIGIFLDLGDSGK
jgi:hypothetical protein